MTHLFRRWKPSMYLLGCISCLLILANGLLASALGLFLHPGELGWDKALHWYLALSDTLSVAALILGFMLAARLPKISAAGKPSSRKPAFFGLSARESAAAAEPQSLAVPESSSRYLAMALEENADTSDRLRMVESLRRANIFWSSLIEHSTDAIYLTDLEGNIQRANPAFEALYGYREEEVTGSFQPFMQEQEGNEFIELIRKVKNGEEVSGYETVRKTKEGKEIHVSLTLSPVRLDDGEPVALAAISRNITERKETEELLRRSEKLSVIGQLAAGVAHEIRNPLTTLRGFVQLFKQRHAENQEYLDLMLEEVERINFIVSEFIILSKPHLNQFLLKDPGELLQDTLRVLQPQSHMSSVRLEASIERNLPRMLCEENLVKQVFLNVIKNGMESMPEGGVMRIEAAAEGPERIRFRFTDHGTGISRDMLRRLGEPFLTSKKNGTGLGIMVSQQIIANHKGRLLFTSELGEGTCVEIVLPVNFRQLSEDLDEEETGSAPDAAVQVQTCPPDNTFSGKG
ncbi:MAG: PAS domain S-box protein [Magnetospirillum sp.]|nr:PAS domain S-box protein [Magnetospirillum sp.]